MRMWHRHLAGGLATWRLIAKNRRQDAGATRRSQSAIDNALSRGLE
jgi:hypothetical protein